MVLGVSMHTYHSDYLTFSNISGKDMLNLQIKINILEAYIRKMWLLYILCGCFSSCVQAFSPTVFYLHKCKKKTA